MVKGEKKNLLTMISDQYPGKSKYNYRALFQCECGNIKDIHVRAVSCGRTKSCGCLQRAYAKTRTYRHGASESRLYRIWNDMKNRCLNDNYAETNYYKGRGIKICNEWKDDFVVFQDWAIKNGYKDNLSIDRIDGNKGYYPENCRWADAKTQSRNRRSNIAITHNGKTQLLIEWCEELGLPFNTIAMRIRRGWDREKAITTPIRK